MQCVVYYVYWVSIATDITNILLYSKQCEACDPESIEMQTLEYQVTNELFHVIRVE